MTNKRKSTPMLTCVRCGCTDDRACIIDGIPCHWISTNPPICSNPQCQQSLTPDFGALANESRDPERDRLWFDQCMLRLGEVDAFRVLEGASFLEGTLQLKRGRVHFEWDADADGPLFLFLLDVVQHGETLPAIDAKE